MKIAKLDHSERVEFAKFQAIPKFRMEKKTFWPQNAKEDLDEAQYWKLELFNVRGQVQMSVLYGRVIQ